MPNPSEWDYTFDHLAEVVEALLVEVDFTGPMGIYLQDYGGPIGNRMVARHPDWLERQVIQNSNSYEEGFTAAWDGIRHALWVDRSPETEAPLEAFLQPETVKAIYTTGHRDPTKISPDNWHMDLFFLARPDAHRVQLDLFHDYRTNAALYPAWQATLRETQPRTLILWGQGDIFFTPEGGEAYLRDLPDAELAPTRLGSLRRRGQPRRDHRSDRRLLRDEGASGRPGVGGLHSGARSRIAPRPATRTSRSAGAQPALRSTRLTCEAPKFPRRQQMATATQPFTGVYELDRNHSSVQFAVRHVQVSTFRASFADIDARLVAEDDAIALEGRALVESISIVEPAEFRDHVVRGFDFFDADAHPAITFRSTSLELGDDESVTVSGQLTIRGVSRSVTAHGTYRPPRQDPFGAYRVGLELAATVDRRGWEMNWQLSLPDGSDALGWDVEITVQLELVKQG